MYLFFQPQRQAREAFVLVDTDLSFKKTQVLLCHAPSSGDTEVPTGAGGPWTGPRAALREPKLESRWCNPTVSHALRFYKRCVWCSSYPHGSGPRGTEGAVERQPGLGHLPDGTLTGLLLTPGLGTSLCSWPPPGGLPDRMSPRLWLSDSAPLSWCGLPVLGQGGSSGSLGSAGFENS